MPDKRYVYYTEEEDGIIRENFGKVSLSQLETMLPDRSFKSIHERARRMGIVAPIKKNCVVCGKDFETKMGALAKCCSQECSTTYWYKKNASRHNRSVRQAEKLRINKLPKTFQNWSKQEVYERLWEPYKGGRIPLHEFAKSLGYGENLLRRLFKYYFPGEYNDDVEEKKKNSKYYQRGREFEYRIRDVLIAKGYWVLRSPQSKSPVDLIALKMGTQSLMIQCKTSKAYMKKKDWDELDEVARTTGSLPLLAYRTAKSRHWQITFETRDGRIHEFDEEIIREV